MKRRLLAGLAAIVLCTTSVAPVVAQAAPTGAGGVAVAAGMPMSATDETKVPHYYGPYPNWANSPQALADAIVTITPPAPVVPAPVTVGNALIDRAYATDFATPPGTLGPAFVVVQGALLPAGTLDSFLVWNQAAPGGSPTPSAGNLFHAYVLHATGTAGQYSVLYDSGELTMPVLADPAVSAVAVFPVSPALAVAAGDVIAFYGEGVPVDTGVTLNPDLLSYPATADLTLATNIAPAQGDTITLGVDPGFPIYSQDRTYSIAATVTPPTPPVGGGGATATATVDPKTGGISAITVTQPGSGYTAPPTVTIDSPGITPSAPASAVAVISQGVVSSVAVAETGFGFTAPQVSVTGGNPTTPATLQASGGVDDVTIVDGGSGYTLGPVVEFSLPNLSPMCSASVTTNCFTQATGSATMDASGVVNGITVANSGSGYTSAPTVTIWDGIASQNAAVPATASGTINVLQIDVTSGGLGYDSAPAIAILDNGVTDRGASAVATVAVLGAVTAINVTAPGAGYITPGLKKFVDTLPGLGAGAANNLGQYIPVAVPDTTTYPGSDYYEIAVVQYRQQYSSQLPAALARGYVQLSTSVVPGTHVPLGNANLDPSIADTPILLNGEQVYGVDNPHYLGPAIVATKDRPVRILFRDLLPTGVAGDLFLPVDTTFMGAGAGPDMMQLDGSGVPMDMAADQGTVLDGVRNPMCGEPDPVTGEKMMGCYTENRATLHLHGGITPWISDGTPHQWTTPAGENTSYPEGVSVQNVPDMPDPGPGAITFFYTNQQSARLMFYHDHAWGITRLNVYAGEAAAYLVTDATEQSLITNGLIPANQIPLVIQDRTFVPDQAAMAREDPTWDYSRWGGMGNVWYEHVYMPAENPNDPSGLSSFGRWFYGPYFWPPATPKYPAIANPYYDPTCNLDDAATWQYPSDPFCEPPTIPGTPNLSSGMEQFNDTPIVNGTAYPTTTVNPTTVRFRILNAANDRFWNLSWYVADPRTGTLSEVALKPAEVAAAQTDPNVVPTPDTTWSPAGPDWVQIGTEGGFLSAPVVTPASPTVWITDPTRFDWGNVDHGSLIVAPAERADVIVDFSQYRGKTLILYNDAPAAFPGRISCYDYYTGGPDLSPACAPSTLPGYGPNTRTIMQVKVSTAAPSVAFDRPNTTSDGLGRLQAAFAHHADGSGVFESGSDPIIVGQAAYNSAYGSTFAGSGWCSDPAKPSAKCDGYARIQEQGGDTFKFDTLSGNQIGIPIQPKAIHDEMNSSTFDEYGRMTSNMGVEAPGATPLTQNIVLYPYVNPATEVLDSSGLPSSLDVTPISTNSDGTQIWKITHNGVDTHPVHWHLYDVQVINRVTWDGIIIPPFPNELGWKETVRVSPLEDTYVAVRPIVPTIPFGVMDSMRPLNPMMPIGARGSATGPGVGQEAGFNNTGVDGNPLASPIVNDVVNFGWEYVWHCHILSHEEMDMMRPQVVHVARALPDAPVLTFARGSVILNWTDGTPVDYLNPLTWGNPKNEVGFRIERAEVVGGVIGAYTLLKIAPANSTTYTDIPPDTTASYAYRVSAFNAASASGAASNVIIVQGLPKAPTGLAAVVQAAPTLPSGSQVALNWTNNDIGTSIVVERAVGAGAFGVLATLAPTDTSYVDQTVMPGPYSYRVNAVNAVGASGYAGPVTVTVPQPGSTTVALNAPNPSFVGDTVTFTATVSPLLATGTPSGTVTFTGDGNTTVVALDATGVATYGTAALAAGTYTITAAYGGDVVFLPSSASVTQTVNKTATTTIVVSSLNPSVAGQSVTFTATVSPSTATGSIDFNIDGASVGVVAIAGGQAAFTTSTLAVGAHPVFAAYGGDPAYLASTSPTITQTVGPALRPTSTVVTSNRNPTANLGQSITFTATVRPVTGIGIPTGSVQFTIDGVAVGGGPLNAQGIRTFSTSTLAAGSHNVIATYSGSAVFAGGSSATFVQVVNMAASTTAITSNRNPAAVFGQSVTFTARVTPLAATGTVQFSIDGSLVGGPVALNATGRATVVISTLGVGSHVVSAAYSGNANYNPSSANLTQQVNKATSRTVVTTSGSPANAGTTVVFTATVTAVAPGAGIPTGTVQFLIDGVNAAGGLLTLNPSGQAAYATTALPVGLHVISAVYSGDAGFNASTSANRNQRIR